MKTRQVTLRIVCDLPEDISVVELKEYTQQAVRKWGISYHSSNPFSSTKLLNSMKVLGKYKRRVL